MIVGNVNKGLDVCTPRLIVLSMSSPFFSCSRSMAITQCLALVRRVLSKNMKKMANSEAQRPSSLWTLCNGD